MRTLTAAETTALQAAIRRNWAKVEVQNGSGTWVDYTDWLLRLVVGGSIDQKIAGATVTFRRDKSPASQYSLAPYMTTSDLNVLDDGVTYSPAIDLGRRIRISLATIAAGSTPAAGDFHMVFVGYVRDIDPTLPEMKVEVKDLGVLLRDRLIESETTYAQQAMESMIQSILTDWAGVTLYSINGDATTPFKATDAPGYTVNETPFDGITVWEAIEKITQLNGWVARYRWNANVGAFVFTLYEPDRAKSVADWTHGPDRYFDVRGLRTRIDNIRNRIGGWYHDANGAKQVVTPIEDATSIGQYGKQYMAFREGPESPIDTLSEWNAMAEPALADLKDPDAEQEIELPLFWPVEIEDLNAFTANGIHYDTDQKWAVVGYRHELDFTQQPSRERTSIIVRGSVAGSYRSWLRRKGVTDEPPEPDLDAAAYQIHNVRITGETATHYIVSYETGIAIEEVWGAAAAYSGETVTDAMQDATRAAIEYLSDGDGSISVPKPEEGQVSVAWLQGVMYRNGSSVDLGGRFFTIGGDRALIMPDEPRFTENAAGTQATVALGITDPRGVVSGVNVYLMVKGAETGPHAATLSGGEWVYTFALDPKHVTIVRLVITRSDGGPAVHLGPYTADTNKAANVLDTAVAYDGDGGAVITAGFDTDTASAEWSDDGGATWTPEPVTNYEAVFPVVQDSVAYTVRVRGINAAGAAGDYRTVDIEAYVAPPPPPLVTRADVTEPSGSGWSVTISWYSVNVPDDYTITIDEVKDGVPTQIVSGRPAVNGSDSVNHNQNDGSTATGASYYYKVQLRNTSGTTVAAAITDTVTGY